MPPKDGPYFDDYGLALGLAWVSDDYGKWVGEDDSGTDYYAGLLTDGAKTWTRDGYFRPVIEGLDDDGQPIRLRRRLPEPADRFARRPAAGRDAQNYPGEHYKSIVKVLVYAPADGLVTDKAPIWEYQVHKVWEAPEVTTITLSPTSAVTIAGLETQSIVATVLDQFDFPMPGVALTSTRTCSKAC